MITNAAMSSTERKLRIIYLLTAFHCAFMLVWSIASTFFHDQIKTVEVSPGNGYMPFKIFSKYEGQTLIYAAHIAPAIFWSLCIPIQFHPAVRKQFPRFHRYLGRAFIGTSCLMMLGVGIIIRRKLTWEHHVNRDDGDEKNPFVITKLPGRMQYSFADFQLAIIGAIFLYTAWVAVGYAKTKDYSNHMIWIIRHCSWGLWVATQRIILVFIFQPLWIITFGLDGEFSGKGRYYSFYLPALAGIFVSVGTAEYAISLIKKEQRAGGT